MSDFEIFEVPNFLLQKGGFLPTARLAYATRSERNRFDIALVDLVTLAARRLTAGNGSNEAPTFAPDGRRIAFTSTRAGGTQIFVLNAADGGSLEQLTSEGSNWAPDWSGYLK